MAFMGGFAGLLVLRDARSERSFVAGAWLRDSLLRRLLLPGPSQTLLFPPWNNGCSVCAELVLAALAMFPRRVRGCAGTSPPWRLLYLRSCGRCLRKHKLLTLRLFIAVLERLHACGSARLGRSALCRFGLQHATRRLTWFSPVFCSFCSDVPVQPSNGTMRTAPFGAASLGFKYFRTSGRTTTSYDWFLYRLSFWRFFQAFMIFGVGSGIAEVHRFRPQHLDILRYSNNAPLRRERGATWALQH
jgi:hypothetical protein